MTKNLTEYFFFASIGNFDSVHWYRYGSIRRPIVPAPIATTSSSLKRFSLWLCHSKQPLHCQVFETVTWPSWKLTTHSRLQTELPFHSYISFVKPKTVKISVHENISGVVTSLDILAIAGIRYSLSTRCLLMPTLWNQVPWENPQPSEV